MSVFEIDFDSYGCIRNVTFLFQINYPPSKHKNTIFYFDNNCQTVCRSLFREATEIERVMCSRKTIELFKVNDG